MATSPPSIIHGAQDGTKYVTFEFLLHAAFEAAEICVNQLEGFMGAGHS